MASPLPCKHCSKTPSINHHPVTRKYTIVCRSCKHQINGTTNLNETLAQWDKQYGAQPERIR